MLIIDVLGWVGGTLLTLNLIPQIYKIRVTEKVDDISSTFIIVNVVGLVLYSVYGWCYTIYQIAVSSSVSLCISLYLMYLKLTL